MNEFIAPVLFFIGTVAVSLIGMFLVRRSVSLTTLESHHEVAGFVYAVIGVIYAVILAFIVILVWEQFILADERLEDEASSLSNVYRCSSGLQDAETKEQFHKLINEYIETMKTYEFKAMANYTTSKENMEVFHKMWNFVYSINPIDKRDEFWLDKTVESMKSFQLTRRLRILSVDFGVPKFTWFVMLIGAFITIGFTFLFGTKRVMPQLIIVVSLSSMIALVLILIQALDHPFNGIIQVDANIFKLLQRNIGH